jgi:hypothetical protein
MDGGEIVNKKHIAVFLFAMVVGIGLSGTAFAGDPGFKCKDKDPKVIKIIKTDHKLIIIIKKHGKTIIIVKKINKHHKHHKKNKHHKHYKKNKHHKKHRHHHHR